MFQKENNVEKKVAEKKKTKNRTRNQLLNFHLTAEEKEYIFNRVKLSGLTKQEYFLQSLMYQQVVCIGNITTFDEMRNQLTSIKESIESCENLEMVEQEKLETLRMILELYNGLENKDFKSIRDKSDAPIIPLSNTPRYKNGTVMKRKLRSQKETEEVTETDEIL